MNAMRDFARQADSADWAIVYYAGHGMEVAGMNYLIPIDAMLETDRDIGFEAVPLDQVLNAAERAGKLRLVVLDACRDTSPRETEREATVSVPALQLRLDLGAAGFLFRRCEIVSSTQRLPALTFLQTTAEDAASTSPENAEYLSCHERP